MQVCLHPPTKQIKIDYSSKLALNRCNFVRIHVLFGYVFIASATEGVGEVEQIFFSAGNTFAGTPHFEKKTTSGEIHTAEAPPL